MRDEELAAPAFGRTRIRRVGDRRRSRISQFCVSGLRGTYAARYAYLRQRQASASYDATGGLGDIRVPAPILPGRRHRSVPVDLAERMHAGIPGSPIEPFRGGQMFFLFAERQRFLDQAGRSLAR